MRTLLIWHAVIVGYLVVGFGMAALVAHLWPHVKKDARPLVVLVWPFMLGPMLITGAFSLLGRVVEEVLP